MQAEYEAKLEAVALRKEDRPKVREAPREGWALGAAAAAAPLVLSEVLSLDPCGSGGQAQLGCVGAMTVLHLFSLISFFWNLLTCTWGFLLFPQGWFVLFFGGFLVCFFFLVWFGFVLTFSFAMQGQFLTL